jgi:site-specific DNA-methyltransferase (adenine-specific)
MLPEPYYDRDGITIYCGDCRDVLPHLDPVGVIVTDPPYGIGWSRGVHAARQSRSHDGIANDNDTTARDEMLLLIEGIPGIVFGSFYAPYPENTKQVLVWKKPDDSGVVGSVTGYRRDVEPVFLIGPWPTTRVKWSGLLTSRGAFRGHTAAETGHPHAKPIDLMRLLIDRCPPGTILDPFMGSGTTLRAAKDLGRRAIGIEIEKRYCEIAVKRLQQSVLPGMAA